MVDTSRLEGWAKLLLDTGKGNNLINFRDGKLSSVEVLSPAPEELFAKVDGGASLEVFDPKLFSDDEVEEGQDDSSSAEPGIDAREAYMAEYSPRMRRSSQILVYNALNNPILTLKGIARRARAFNEETGVNVSYMAFGFISWREQDNSTSFKAPLLLIPVHLEQQSAVDPIRIEVVGDDIIVNPTFAYKLSTDYGVMLPEYDDEGLNAYLEKVDSLISKLGWSVSSACRIGIFSFLKINMYQDLKENAARILENPNVLRLLGEPVDEKADAGEDTKIQDPLIELHSVVDADSSQIEAIEMAKSGRSFVLQGPPGTGKSQTITNIIAECLNDGKKILFVSEKLAALNVVYEKLKQVGLAEFCLQLHSHKASKKDVIDDLCHTLRLDGSRVSSQADTEIALKQKAERQLDDYAGALHRIRPVIQASLYQLYERYSARRSAPDVEFFIPDIETRSNDFLLEATSLISHYVDFVPSLGYDYRKNPWYGFIRQDTSFQSKAEVKSDIGAVSGMVAALIPSVQEFSSAYGTRCESLDEVHSWSASFDLLSRSEFITPAFLKEASFAHVRQVLADLKVRSAHIREVRTRLSQVFDDGFFNVDGAATKDRLLRKFHSFFARLFSPEYRRLKKEISLYRKDGGKLSYAEMLKASSELADLQQSLAQFAAVEEPIKGHLGSAYRGVETAWDELERQLSVLADFFQRGLSFGILAERQNLAGERHRLSEYHRRLEEILSTCDQAVIDRLQSDFDQRILNFSALELGLLSLRLSACRDRFDLLDKWCHLRNLLTKLSNLNVLGFIDASVDSNIEPDQFVSTFERRFFLQWIDAIISHDPALASFDRIIQDAAVETFAEKDLEQFEINRAKIRATLSSQRPALGVIAPGSALATLLREGEKKRRQKSIRTLLGEIGELVQRIKPCFLMSPLSVSTFLPPEAIDFDLVIFDEASQIFPQDAIGAIYRGKQLIVVGDSKQMPPSNFFNASIEASEGDDDDERITDFESILDLCATSQPQLRLCWHYRSRYEQLIAFYNQHFYDDDLITFPAPRPDGPGIGVDYYHVDGIFDRQSHTNRREAEFIVDLIYRHIEQHPERSLGVVAFSVAQQTLIDRLLSKRRQSEPAHEDFFKSDRREPFFIKNLETVQGDERDTIIFSIAYGFDARGHLLHNFGPLNRAGGERRLNVAITRARCNVQVVASIHHTDIDLTRTGSEGARLLRAYLDFAENGTLALNRDLTVSDADRFDSEFELEVAEFLRAQDYAVDTQVGCSGFRIDLALKRPDSSDYLMAIECDGATYHHSKNARDRDRLRQQILEGMGWHFYRIWSTDWFRNRAVEQARLLAAVEEALSRPAAVDEVEPETQPTFEVPALPKALAFPRYTEADIAQICRAHPSGDFLGIVRDILEVESPLSEELLLKRMAWYFGRQRVTSRVVEDYEQRMARCQRQGIVRRDGFLYIDDDRKITFRSAGTLERELRQIAPEELADGLYQIIQQNVTVEREGLYRALASQCGLTRVGRAALPILAAALNLLADRIEIDGDLITLK